MQLEASSLKIKSDLVVFLGATRLGYKGAPRKLEVPPGQVIVLSYGYEFADASGLPEVYQVGEVVACDPLRRGVPCWAIQLAEFPGRVDVRASRVLAAISRGEDDPASMTISFYVRLYDPILLLRRKGGKWEEWKKENISALNQSINEDVTERLRALLEKDLQIWSGDERDVLGGIFSELDKYLRSIGLEVDTTEGGSTTSAVIFTRHYPSALYDLAFQFSKAERALRHLLQRGVGVPQEVGFSAEEVRRIAASVERAGVAFFRAVTNASPETRELVAQWMERSGMPDAAQFIKTLYEKFPEREIKLSEQVLLSAIRNPWLTRGEWLKEMAESPISRFQQIERRIRSLPVGS